MKSYIISFNWQGPKASGIANIEHQMNEIPTYNEVIDWQDSAIELIRHSGRKCDSVVMVFRLEIRP